MHEILAATVGAIAVVIVGVVPLLLNVRVQRSLREQVEWAAELARDIRRHLPDNGDRLYMLVDQAATHSQQLVQRLGQIESRIANLEGKVDVLIGRRGR